MRLPVIFVGHGSPMNAIENNVYTKAWEALGKRFKPEAILMISAHWFTKGTRVQDAESPAIINDMYGFPRPLYEVGYQVKGNKALTKAVLNAVKKPVSIDNDWGIDHGAWSVLNHMYPKKDIPVVQLSVDAGAMPNQHYAVGQDLSRLREKNILIIGSGNIVHNLRRVSMEMAGGYPDCVAFDAYIKNSILNHNHQAVIDYAEFGEGARLSVPTTDHFDPLLYALGAAGDNSQITVFNESLTMGSLSMTSYLFE